jgi:hypothetical protein
VRSFQERIPPHPWSRERIEDGVLLKWKDEFGTTLESCVILVASSLAKKEKKRNSCLNNSEAERVVDGENLVSRNMDNDLKFLLYLF